MKINFFLLCIILCTGCYQVVEEFEGVYEDPELGTFSTRLQFNDESIEMQYSANEVAEIAAFSLRAIRQIGEENSVDYSNIEDALACVQTSLVQVASVETYSTFCGKDPSSLGCYSPSTKAITLRNLAGYSCQNTYTIGHEFLHAAQDCLNYPSSGDGHDIPLFFAWGENPLNPDYGESRVWNKNTAETIILLDGPKCQEAL